MALRSFAVALVAAVAGAGGCGDDSAAQPAPDAPRIGIGVGAGDAPATGPGAGGQPLLDPPPPCDGRTDVRLYGAAGDGVQVDTFAIQRAIDTCAKSSGTVLVSPGTYLIGPLFFRSNT